MNEKQPREEAIFEGALQLSPDQREAYLQAACGGDGTLRERIRDLIRFHEKADGPLETPAVAPPLKATIVPRLPPGEKPGDKIGNYKILQLIGEGGCGSVFMAEQEQPVRRRVALKIIKLGMDTKLVVARFEAERQALALMDHPSIARVLDAGATDTNCDGIDGVASDTILVSATSGNDNATCGTAAATGTTTRRTCISRRLTSAPTP